MWAFMCGLVPLLLYQANAMGGGDVKLLLAVGALLQTRIGIDAEFYAIVAGMVFGMARLAWEGKLLRTLGNTLALSMNLFRPARKRREVSSEMMTSLRFGPAIFAGAVVAALQHWSDTP